MSGIVDTASNAWVFFVAFAGGVGVLVGFMANVDKIKTRIKAQREKKAEKQALPAQTLKAVNDLANVVAKLSDKVDTIESKVSCMDTTVTNLHTQVNKLKDTTDSQSVVLGHLDTDTADILCSQLVREHDYYMRLGYCPTIDKQRIGGIYERYKARGRNHIADSLLDDLAHLPLGERK